MIKKLCIKWLIFALCLFVWLPLLLMIGNSLMSETELMQRFSSLFGTGTAPVKASIIPSFPTLKPYIELLIDSPGFYVMFWNSFIQTGLGLVGQLLAALPAAWAFAVFSFKGKKGLFFLYIILMLQPFQVMMLPNYLVLKQLNLLNNHLAIILPAMFSAFPVFIMTKFFESVPKALLEAARLDGANDVAIFLKVGVPLGRPGILSAMVLGFIESWNALEQPMTFLKERKLWPLSLYLPEITADKVSVAWAASIVMMVLPVVLFVMGQETLELGIAASGIKE